MANTLGAANPLTYRGYVYDDESELYYLQSRYYNANVGRFINADAFTSTGQGVLGNNMFAYCLNNPVNREDKSGYIATEIFYAAFGEETLLYAVSDKKRGENWTPNRNKRKGSPQRQPTGDRERNVKHPNGEEHSRVPKGNGRGIRRFQEACFNETPEYASEAKILTTPPLIHNTAELFTLKNTNIAATQGVSVLAVAGAAALFMTVICFGSNRQVEGQQWRMG